MGDCAQNERIFRMMDISAALVGGLFDEDGVPAYARPVLFGTAGDAVSAYLPDAVGAVWPLAIVQTCVVHLLRNTFRTLCTVSGSGADRNR